MEVSTNQVKILNKEIRGKEIWLTIECGLCEEKMDVNAWEFFTKGQQCSGCKQEHTLNEMVFA